MTISVTPSLLRNLKILSSTLTAIPLALSAYRLIRRCVIRRFWWEDAWAVVALISSVVCVISSWLCFETIGHYYAISFWTHALTYPVVVWSVRLSVLFSLLRVMLPVLRLRRTMILVAALFILAWLLLTISFVVRHLSRQNATLDLLGTRERLLVAIFELIADVLSDVTLVYLAIKSMRHTKLKPSQRRLIIIAYSSCIFVTVVSCLRAACQVLDVPLLITVAIDVEVASSMFVCNFLFFSILIYRLLPCNVVNGDTITSLNALGTESIMLQLTTIDLAIYTNMPSSGVFTLPPVSYLGDDSEKCCQDSLTVPPIKV